MKEKHIPMIKTLELIMVIVLYYIVGNKSLFLYVLSYSLYSIFMSFFDNVTLSKRLVNFREKTGKFKLLKTTFLSIVIISLLFLLLSILVSDITSILLNINDTLIIFIFMGFSIMASPLVKIMTEYLVDMKKNTKYYKLMEIYTVFDYVLVLIIALFVFRVFNVSNHVAIALLYVPKIIVVFILIFIISFMNKRIHSGEKVSYLRELKEIYGNNIHKSIVSVVKNSYYYMSIVILYLVLSSRYGYKLDDVTRDITFVYFYGLKFVLYIVYLVEYANKLLPTTMNKKNIIYNNFKVILSVIIFLGIISPITCKLIFNNSSYAIYLTMVNILAIFILLFDVTYKNVNNKKIIYGGLIAGVFGKLILVLPLINSFYRMGYNLVYGDILSSALGMLLSIIINYLYIINALGKDEKDLSKILNILFDNIVFCIILVIVQFIIPMNTDNYLKTLGLLWIYLVCVYIIIRIKLIQLKRKKRG